MHLSLDAIKGPIRSEYQKYLCGVCAEWGVVENCVVSKVI